MSRIYYISWIEDQHILECLRHSEKEVEAIQERLKVRGLHPLVVCDFTESFAEEQEIKMKKRKI